VIRKPHIIPTLVLFAAMSLSAFAAAPELGAVFPSGVQRGTQFDLTLQGARLGDAEAILFYRSGVTVESLAAEDNKVTARCTIDASCELGEMPLRLRTRSGLTELRTLYVGAMPVVAETEPNNAFDSAQSISLDVTVDGKITREDIDYFAVDAKAGERITAEIEAMRLGRTMFDPCVAILDARRFELSASDDSVLLLQDSVASAIAPEDGRYVILVRDASFQGNDQSCYRLHVGRYPRPRVAFPPGGRPGENVAIELRGDVAGAMKREIQLPAAPTEAWPTGVSDETGVAPSPIWLRVGPEAVVNEPQAADAEPPAPPIAFQGVVEKPGESDEWRFSAKKDQTLLIRAVGRQIRSPIDAVIDILNADGGALAGNDDARGPDCELEFKAPADGVYRARIRDHLQRGGPLFVYRIEIAPREPSLSVSMEVRDRRRPQFLQTLEAPRGGRFAGLFRVSRSAIGGPVDVTIADLPAGITATTTQLDGNESLLPVVIEATGDGALAGALCPIVAKIPRGESSLEGGFSQSIPLVIGPPNEQIYYATTVDRIPVALTEAAPFRIDVDAPPAPLLREGPGALHIRLTRNEGFDAEVETMMLWNPAGVSSAGSAKIPPNASETNYPINASGDAPLRTHQLVILARARVGDADRWVSSALIPLQVADRYVTGALKMCAIQREQSAAMLCQLKHVRPFDGEATLTLRGLPPGVTTAPVQIQPGQAEAIFTLSATDAAPVGRRGGLFCEITTKVNGVDSTHRFAGGGVIRVDPKPVQVVQKTPEPEKAPKAEEKPAPPKPLSRLQQLRKEAAERRNASTAGAENNAEKPTQ